MSKRATENTQQLLGQHGAQVLFGYNSATTSVDSLALAAQTKPTREGVLQAMGSLGRLDLNGYSLTYSPTSRHGSTMVELTILSRGNRFVQ
jgi:branched-chain amino acid transport system substrate-binding protein